MYIRSYLLDTESIVSCVRSRNIIFTPGAISCTDFSALPVKVLRVDKQSLELRALGGMRVTDFLGQRHPEGEGKVSKQNSIVKDLQSTRKRSDKTVVSVGMFTVSMAHRPQSSLSTGLRHFAFHQSLTVSHGNFVVFVAFHSVEEHLVV